MPKKFDLINVLVAFTIGFVVALIIAILLSA